MRTDIRTLALVALLVSGCSTQPKFTDSRDNPLDRHQAEIILSGLRAGMTVTEAEKAIGRPLIPTVGCLCRQGCSVALSNGDTLCIEIQPDYRKGGVSTYLSGRIYPKSAIAIDSTEQSSPCGSSPSTNAPQHERCTSALEPNTNAPITVWFDPPQRVREQTIPWLGRPVSVAMAISSAGGYDTPPQYSITLVRNGSNTIVRARDTDRVWLQAGDRIEMRSGWR